MAGEGGGEGEGVDGGDARSEGGGDAGHTPGASKKEDALGAELVGEVHAGGDDAIGLALSVDFFFIANGARAFDTPGDTIKNLEAGAGVGAGGGFARKHDGIGAFKDGVGDISDFGAGGQGLGDHAFEHMGGDDDGFHGGDALFDDTALDDGELLVGAFNAEIAAGDHDGVGGRNDAEDIFDGELVFNLGNNFYFRAAVLVEEGAEGEDVFGVSNEREGDPIDARGEADEEIGGVFGGDGGQIDADPGEVDVATIPEDPGGKDTTGKGGGIFLNDLEVNDAVIDEKFLAGLEIVNEIGVVNRDGGRGRGGIDAEDESIPDGEGAGGANGAGADGGTLGIEEKGNFLAAAGGESAKFRGDLAHKIVRGVGKVEAKDFGATIDELGQGLRVSVFGAESGDEFSPAGVR